MDFAKIIAELKAERERIDQAMSALDRVAQSSVRRRGRRPNWMLETGANIVTGSFKKRVVSPEARQRMAEAQRRRWAKARESK